MTSTLQGTAGERDDRSDPASRLRRTLEGLVGVPATEGNRIEVLRNGDQIFPAMLDAIGAAQHTIDLLTFVYWEGEIGRAFAEALAERAAAGVRVRVLLDAVGARRVRRELLGVMEGGGCHVEWFRPVTRLRPSTFNHRTHRKVLICDEEVSFTGGVGIADEWRGDARDEHEWRDTHFRIHGPATDGLRAAFIDNWCETQCALFEPDVDRFPDQEQPGDAVVQVVRGAAEPGWNDISTALRALLQLAERRVRITTAYLCPDAELQQHLCDAAGRGAEVEILLPGPHADKRFVRTAGEAVFSTLVEAGVRIAAYQPTMLHAKVTTIDHVVSVVGSANFNHRSHELDEEVDLIVFDADLTRTLDEHFDDDRSRSEPIESGRWARRSLRQRSAEAVSQLARPFL